MKEVDPRTMESKKVQGLFLPGDVGRGRLHRGYNLQIAFATGRLAGNHLGESGGRAEREG